MTLLGRLRLFEKALLPLVLMATLFAITLGMGVIELRRSVAAYREILSRNAPAVLRIERLNALTDQVGYAVDRSLYYHCLGAQAAQCARAAQDFNAAVAEGEQRLDEAVRFDPDHRADYEAFRQTFRDIVSPARRALALSLRDANDEAEAIMNPVDQRILVLSGELFRYSSQRTIDNRTEGLALARSAEVTELIMLVVGTLAAAVGLGFMAWIAFAEMAFPIERLRRRMTQLASGDLDVEIEGQRRRDEIGEMARAVQVFKANAHAKILAEAAAETARVAAANAARDAQAEIARVARVLSVGELASSIAHEINQPIAAIAANGQTTLGWLEREPPDIDRAKAAAERTIRDARRAGAVVSRVRGMLAKTANEFAPVDANQVIEEVLGFIEDERVRSRVTIQTRLGRDLPPVMGDPIQLQQALLNLVMNGMDAMRGSPEKSRALIVSSSFTGEGWVRVAVEDRGAGIEPDVIDRVFEPFFTTKQSGIGLGLAITRSIIEAHGGRIWAEAATPHGARFQFTLPAMQAG